MSGFEFQKTPAEDVKPTSKQTQKHGTVIHTNRWWKFGGQDHSYMPAQEETPASPSSSLNQDIENVTSAKADIHGSVFDDVQASEFYQPIEKYEGRHRFEPNATWSKIEERNLVRRVRKRFP